MAESPQYTSTPISRSATISTSGTVSTIYTSTNGTHIESILVKANSTTTAGIITIYKNSKKLFDIPVTAITPSASVGSFETVKNINEYNLYLEIGDTIGASTSNSESFEVYVIGGEF